MYFFTCEKPGKVRITGVLDDFRCILQCDIHLTGFYTAIGHGLAHLHRQKLSSLGDNLRDCQNIYLFCKKGVRGLNAGAITVDGKPPP